MEEMPYYDIETECFIIPDELLEELEEPTKKETKINKFKARLKGIFKK